MVTPAGAVFVVPSATMPFPLVTTSTPLSTIVPDAAFRNVMPVALLAINVVSMSRVLEPLG